jgi:hypothetical protein
VCDSPVIPFVGDQLTAYPMFLTPDTSSSGNSALMTFLPDFLQTGVRFQHSSRLRSLPFQFFIIPYRETLVVSLSKPQQSWIQTNDITTYTSGTITFNAAHLRELQERRKCSTEMFLVNRNVTGSTPNRNAYVPIPKLLWSAPESHWLITLKRSSLRNPTFLKLFHHKLNAQLRTPGGRRRKKETEE